MTICLPVSQIPKIFNPKFRKGMKIPDDAEQFKIVFEVRNTNNKQAEKLESTGEVFYSFEDFVTNLEK